MTKSQEGWELEKELLAKWLTGLAVAFKLGEKTEDEVQRIMLEAINANEFRVKSNEHSKREEKICEGCITCDPHSYTIEVDAFFLQLMMQALKSLKEQAPRHYAEGWGELVNKKYKELEEKYRQTSSKPVSEWEEEFDDSFDYIFDKLTYGKTGKESIKSFIRQNFIPRQQLLDKVEGLRIRKTAKNQESNISIKRGAYNRAIDDLKAEIMKGDK